MPVYAYKGVTESGKAIKGHLDAETSRSARSRLRRDGIFITDFRESSAEAVESSASGPRFNVSFSHAGADVDHTLAACEAALIAVGEAIADGRPAERLRGKPYQEAFKRS